MVLNLIKELKKSPSLTLFYIFCFCIPFWRRINIGEFKGEYNSLFLYLTDILFLFVLIVWIFELLKKKEKFYWGYLPVTISFGALICWSLISLIGAFDKTIGIFKILTLFEYFLFYLFLVNKLTLDVVKNIFKIMVGSGLFQVLIASIQFFKNSSIGLFILGEQPIDPSLLGIAKINLDGFKHIRAYGTFPHPNVLAGFLVILLIAILIFFYQSQRKKIKLLAFSLLLVFFFGLLLTFSRSSWLVFLLAFGAISWWEIFVLKKQIKRNLTFVSLFLLIAFLLILLFFPYIKARFYLEPYQLIRIERTEFATNLIKSHPIKGVGIGNFVPGLLKEAKLKNWQYQPVHNSYLLIISEIGFIGFLLFFNLIYWLYRNLKAIRFVPKNNYQRGLALILAAILILFLFDHYFWTIKQTEWCFWLIVGLIAKNEIYPNSKSSF